ncbi:hypothetical protein N7474_007801 [Penicillium riverlandense]|uniref:uncharacterized protein n=1 Tax=Penicillium riverlandense TaxID=1903569 RepID=UPI0025497471|nr:uncharacterized protein N7474_007801 [Penicillium riverlandense]KAJ5811500.1 hypothetical protein N7474_007801 [Penicillium riverlandense]
MALLTRLRARASFQPADANNNSQPASKPRKLVKKRSSRASFAEPSAPDGPVNPDAWREPTPAPARRTWKESLYKLSPATNPILATMKPLGEFPSAAEYRAVNLIPPSVKKNRAAKSLQQQAVHVVGEAIESDTPMTPLAEEAVADVPRLDVEMENIEPISEVATRKNSVEDSVGADAMEDGVAEVDDAIATNLATPVSEAVDGKQTARTSISPATDTPATDAVIAPVTQPISTAPETQLEAVITSTSPLPDAQTTSAPALFKGPRKKIDVGSPDYVAILNSIPLPSSTEYDVSQLKRVIEAAITHALEKGEGEIALCLVYYWSRSSNDSFLLSLIDNIGRKEPNYQLDLALKTVLRNSRVDAIEWIRKKSIKERTTRRTRAAAADSDSNLSEAKSIDPNKPNQTKPAARKPVPTAFEKGKSNTVPLQKPKNRAPFLEKFHKRREEWENDEELGDELRKKRQKLSQDQQNVVFPNAKVSLCRSTLNKGADRTDQDESARQHYRSLSIDTHLSDMSILSDSDCSERINDWVAPHDPRYMPNQM